MRVLENREEEKVKSFKLGVGLFLLFLLVIFTIQNAEALEVKFLFWTLTMRRALLLFLVLAIGVLLGWALHSHAMHRSSAEGDPDRSPPR